MILLPCALFCTWFRATFYIVLKSFKMSQFNKALLKKYLSKENEEENESGSE